LRVGLSVVRGSIIVEQEAVAEGGAVGDRALGEPHDPYAASESMNEPREPRVERVGSGGDDRAEGYWNSSLADGPADRLDGGGRIL
jgi:hypothetical protein